MCVASAARPHAPHEVAAWVMMKLKLLGNSDSIDIRMYMKRWLLVQIDRKTECSLSFIHYLSHSLSYFLSLSVYISSLCLCSDDVRVPRPDVPPQVLTDGAGEGDTVQVAEAVPRVLDHVEQNEEQHEQQDNSRNASNHHPPLDDAIDIILRLFHLLRFINIVQAVVRNKDPREEKAEHKPSDVGKVVNEGEEAEEEEEEDHDAEL